MRRKANTLSLIILLVLSMQTMAKEKPNIVLILADDLGYECVGANGGSDYQTPVLDQLAKEGLRFTNCYANPICTPSRVKIMTGKYNFRNYYSFAHMDHREYTFGNLMRDAGYSTFIGGKWQLNGNGRWRVSDSLKYKRIDRQGFDEYCLTMMNLGMQNLYWDPVIEQNETIYGQVRKTRTISNPDIYVSESAGEMKEMYGPDLVNAQVCDFISRKKDKPFFVYYSMMLPHTPLMSTPDSPKRDIADPKCEFTDMVAYTDKLVGKIRDHLDSEGVLDNTVIIFTGDNGTYCITSKLNGEDYKGGKASLTNNGTWVPLIVYWKGMKKKGKVIDDLIDFSDFFPTLGDAARSDYPMGLTDGRSFWPQIRGEAGDPREWVFVQHDSGLPIVYPKTGRFVRDKRYKLYEDGRFFDLHNDLQELDEPLDKASLSKDARMAYTNLRAVLSGFPAWRPITQKPKVPIPNPQCDDAVLHPVSR